MFDRHSTTRAHRARVRGVVRRLNKMLPAFTETVNKRGGGTRGVEHLRLPEGAALSMSDVRALRRGNVDHI